MWFDKRNTEVLRFHLLGHFKKPICLVPLRILHFQCVLARNIVSNIEYVYEADYVAAQ